MKSGELLIDDDSMDEPDKDNSCDETLTEIDGKSKLNDEDESKDKSDDEEEDEDIEDDEDTESEDSDSRRCYQKSRRVLANVNVISVEIIS